MMHPTPLNTAIQCLGEIFTAISGACGDSAAGSRTQACSREGRVHVVIMLWKVRESSKIDQTENSALVKHDIWSDEKFIEIQTDDRIYEPQNDGPNKWMAEGKTKSWNFRQIPSLR